MPKKTISSGVCGSKPDFLQFTAIPWAGPSPQQDTSEWQEINYKHDVYGRRSEKKVDGYSTRYVYDGDHVIAEYDGNNNLLRKYIYGPGIDQPVCMIEESDSETYYYHYDALGSVVALSDSSGDTVQTYEYSVYGQVAVEDINHPNPYMFAGRRFDIEIGLYYNRARYYNPFIGRFLQADPIGYNDSMNLYAYCGNSPISRTDSSGLYWTGPDDELWAQDYAMSCVPASFVNMAKQLHNKYGSMISGWEITDSLEKQFRQRFEQELGYRPSERKEANKNARWKDQSGTQDRVWGNNGSGVSMEDALKVWNAYLNDVDKGGVLPRYELLQGETKDPNGKVIDEGWWNDTDDILNLVANTGPVMFAQNLSGYFHDKDTNNCVAVTPSDNAWHACSLLRKEDDKYIYANPMSNILGRSSNSGVTELWSVSLATTRSILVPVAPSP